VVLGEDLRRTQQTDLEVALLSRVPGLMKIKEEIAIRGLSSVNSSSQPLILVDGTEVSSLSAVSIQEIETVEVIKSASSYGVRGANGVISIKLRTR
jgi:outer membrane receptor for ferrienterochelin and colicin